MVFSDRRTDWPSHPYSSRDSLHEHDMWAAEGLTHRYPTKVLAELLPTCPQYCGHCTRMDLVGNSTPTVDKLKFLGKPVDRHAEMLDNLHRTKEIGYESRKLLVEGDLERYAELMHVHWENKRKRSPGMVNPRIDNLYTLARRAGAVGGKLVGAGGGGFLLVYAQRPEATRQALAAAGASELPFDFDFQGAIGTEYA